MPRVPSPVQNIKGFLKNAKYDKFHEISKGIEQNNAANTPVG